MLSYQASDEGKLLCYMVRDSRCFETPTELYIIAAMNNGITRLML